LKVLSSKIKIDEEFFNYARILDSFYIPKNDMRSFIERIPEWLEKLEVGFPYEIEFSDFL